MGYQLEQDEVGTSKVCINDNTGHVADTFLSRLPLAIITQQYHCLFASWCSWLESEPLRVGMLSDIALGPPGPSIHPSQRGNAMGTNSQDLHFALGCFGPRCSLIFVSTQKNPPHSKQSPPWREPGYLLSATCHLG